MSSKTGRPWVTIAFAAGITGLIAGILIGLRQTATTPTPEARGAAPAVSAPRTPDIASLPDLRVLGHRTDIHDWNQVMDVAGHTAALIDRANIRDGIRLARVLDDGELSPLGRVSLDGICCGGQSMQLLAPGAEAAFVATAGAWSGMGSYLPGHVVLVDTRDPQNPAVVGKVATNTDVWDMATAAGRLLVAEARGFEATPMSGTLRILDVGGAQPGRELGQLPGDTLTVTTAGELAYVVRACGGRAPVAPTVDTSMPNGYPYGPPSMLEDAYPLCLAAIELADPEHPALLSEVELPGASGDLATAVYGDYVFVADFDGLTVADARDPRRLALLGPPAPFVADRVPPFDNFSTNGDQDLAIHGSVLYLSFDDTVVAYDLAGPFAPRPVAKLKIRPESDGDGMIRLFRLDGDRLLLLTGGGFKDRAALWLVEAPSEASQLSAAAAP